VGIGVSEEILRFLTLSIFKDGSEMSLENFKERLDFYSVLMAQGELKNMRFKLF
jgi:hypothetical protein